MLNIPSVNVFVPSLDPVSDSAPDALDHSRAPRGTTRRGSRGNNHTVDTGSTTGSSTGSSTGTPHKTNKDTHDAPRATHDASNKIIRPEKKPGQKTDAEGWPLNSSNQRVDVNGHAIDKQGYKINKYNQRIDTQGVAKDHKNRPIDPQGRLINREGRLINEKKEFIDKDGNRVNKEGYRVDAYDRPLNKDGKVARSMATAVKGNNEPHKQTDDVPKPLRGPGSIHSQQAAKPPAPQLTTDDAAKNASWTSKLLQSGAIPSRPELARTAINGAVSESAGTLAAIPIKIGETVLTTMTAEEIKKKYLPAPPTPPATAPTPGTNQSPEADKANTEAENKLPAALRVRMENAQVNIFETMNAVVKLTYGNGDKELGPGEEWPVDPIAIMDKLEERMDALEGDMKDLAEKYNVACYTDKLPPEEAPPGLEGLETRTKTLEARLDVVMTSRKDIEEKVARRLNITP
ncbi:MULTISPECIES: hypothetical protein [unclassified Pseudomonas]|uniref:hypothetical protein n=1 Tax=unclassified Pseudomonas TaxID=196821 RepID=UPI001F5A31EC|nr:MULTISPECIES: hypothetical protein [unclassified Pseudomonas]